MSTNGSASRLLSVYQIRAPPPNTARLVTKPTRPIRFFRIFMIPAFNQLTAPGGYDGAELLSSRPLGAERVLTRTTLYATVISGSAVLFALTLVGAGFGV